MNKETPRTRLLYYEDPRQMRFSATVLKRGEVGGQPAVVLDRTAFYPEGGGQPADRGVLDGVRVLDVRRESGDVWHVLERDMPAGPGEEVTGMVDWERRFDFMQQHHGQHLLSAAFEDVLGAKTLSVHMGEKTCTLDVDRPNLTEKEVTDVLERANFMVWSNVPVHARFVDEEELKRLSLRNPPKVSGPVRIVSAGEFDHSPCGGTHPLRTGEVGMIVILRHERHKRGTRVEFVCGKRALTEFLRRNERLLSASMLTGTGWDMLPERVRQLRASGEEANKALRRMKERLAEREADELLLSGERLSGEIPLVCRAWEHRPVDELKRIAERISERGGVALLGTMEGDAAKLVFARGSRPDVNMSDLLKECIKIAGGKGGGRPHLAQGSAPNPQRLGDMLEHAKRRLSQ